MIVALIPHSPARPGWRRALALRLAAAALALGLAAPPAPAHAWGSAVHRLINRHAVDNLPPAFQGFAQWADDLERLATAADERKDSTPGEGIKHYIDIDEYPDFLAGTFPHAYEAAVARYGLNRLESNGIGPWALQASYRQLVADFRAKDWTHAVATAGDIGHYAGDLHQPLHITRNYDGDDTGQSGVHSRFESRLTGQHLGEFTGFPGVASVLDDPLERTFAWIDDTYPGVAEILAADRSARAEAGGSTSSSIYYASLWEQLGQSTTRWIAQASLDVAAFWYSAWVEAGSPALPGTPVKATTWSGIKALYGR